MVSLLFIFIIPGALDALGEDHAAESNYQRPTGDDGVAIVGPSCPLGNNAGKSYKAPNRL